MAKTDDYPDAIDPAAVGSYPAGVKSGGGYFFDEVLEYRVWVHAPIDGSDWFMAFATYEEARKYAEETELAEAPLVLVRQLEFVDEPEPGDLRHVKGDRITEWRVEWLADGPRKPRDIEQLISNSTTKRS